MALNATSALELSVDAYCTLSQVQAYMPAVRTLTSSSLPTKAQAFSIIRDTFSEINGLLDMLGYVIPVASSNTTSIRALGRMNAICAAAAIEASAYSASNEENSDHSSALRALCKESWTRFEKGTVSLPNATRKSSYMHRKDEQWAAAQFRVDADGNEKDPIITMDTEF